MLEFSFQNSQEMELVDLVWVISFYLELTSSNMYMHMEWAKCYTNERWFFLMSLIRIDYSLLKSEGLKQGRWLKGEEVQRTEPVLLDVSNSALSMATGNWPSGLGLMMGQGFAKVSPSLSWPTPHPRRAVCLKVAHPSWVKA